MQLRNVYIQGKRVSYWWTVNVPSWNLHLASNSGSILSWEFQGTPRIPTLPETEALLGDLLRDNDG